MRQLLFAVILVLTFSPVLAAPSYLGRVTSVEEYSKLAAPSHFAGSFDLPMILALVDLEHGDEPYFINANRHAHHLDFLNANYISQERGREFRVFSKVSG
ncbi:MAG: hypothetical protein RQ748_10385 [Elusimicrobiales bacterium]|nr:hypothetical protein [Elusimicrobiales bacterium]